MDFTSLELNKFEYRYLRSEPCGDLMCDVIERPELKDDPRFADQASLTDSLDILKLGAMVALVQENDQCDIRVRGLATIVTNFQDNLLVQQDAEGEGCGLLC